MPEMSQLLNSAGVIASNRRLWVRSPQYSQYGPEHKSEHHSDMGLLEIRA